MAMQSQHLLQAAARAERHTEPTQFNICLELFMAASAFFHAHRGSDMTPEIVGALQWFQANSRESQAPRQELRRNVNIIAASAAKNDPRVGKAILAVMSILGSSQHS